MQSPAVHVQKEHVPAQSAEIANDSLDQGIAQGSVTEQARYDSSGRQYVGSEDRRGETGNAPIAHRPSWSSSAPSAGWSTSSPAASWGASQTDVSAQADQGSSGQSLVQKAKEHLPGGVSNHASKSTTDSSSPGVVEKAKEHLPGFNSAGYTGHGSAGQGQRTTDRPDIPVDDIHSRLGAGPPVPANASTWQSPSDTGGYSTGHGETGSAEAAVSHMRSQDTSSRPDHPSRKLEMVSQRDAGSSTGNAHAGASRSSESDRNTTQYGAGQGTGHSHHGLSGTASEGQHFEYQPGGLTQGYAHQGQAASAAGHGGESDEPVTRLPSTGIPPVFHPPSYITSETPSYGTTGGRVSSTVDSQGVNAKQAIGPLTDTQTGMPGRETSGVNAKQALEPLTHTAAGDSKEEVGGVHAREALQPLTEVPAQEGNKGFVESIKEYLPGQHQAGTIEHQQHSQQPGFLDKAMAYVPSLHSSGHSHPTEEGSATQQDVAYPVGTAYEPQHPEAQPSLLDKAKAYIPVLGSSTDFDPATEGRIGQQESLYRSTPTGQAGLAPEQASHESLLDRAKAYVPAMGASGTTPAGIDAETGASGGPSHKGLVENLVEKAIEILPHQITGADPVPAPTAASATHPYASGANTRDVGPAIDGVRLSDKPILGSHAGLPLTTAANVEAPGMFERVKQLVGLGPASTTSAVRFLFCLAAVHVLCVVRAGLQVHVRALGVPCCIDVHCPNMACCAKLVDVYFQNNKVQAVTSACRTSMRLQMPHQAQS
ncbi:hypothetical protein ABBQ32_014034 [Trebouxia sp. C0010 RCD-2024]